MKITKAEILDQENLMGHIVLHTLAKYPNIIHEINKHDSAEVIMTVNGTEINIGTFIEYWQLQVGSMIMKEAKKLVQDKLTSVSDLIDNTSDALTEAIDHLTNITED